MHCVIFIFQIHNIATDSIRFIIQNKIQQRTKKSKSNKEQEYHLITRPFAVLCAHRINFSSAILFLWMIQHLNFFVSPFSNFILKDILTVSFIINKRPLPVFPTKNIVQFKMRCKYKLEVIVWRSKKKKLKTLF